MLCIPPPPPLHRQKQQAKAAIGTTTTTTTDYFLRRALQIESSQRQHASSHCLRAESCWNGSSPGSVIRGGKVFHHTCPMELRCLHHAGACAKKIAWPFVLTSSPGTVQKPTPKTVRIGLTTQGAYVHAFGHSTTVIVPAKTNENSALALPRPVW
jgi:hypothetical protein